jgi:pimeloyl-ACP methyl ester carboxylesterase
MPVKESRHQVRDVSVRMLQSGSGPLVLFLHGANGLPQWLPFFERLATQFDVRVPEHPGYGTSDNPAWMRNVGDLAMYYLDFLDGLDGGKVNLIGHSLGGWAAAEMATRNCTRLASLTLLAPAGIRVKTLPCGDNFIWGPDEVVRNLFHDQSIAERMLATPMSEDEADIALTNRFATSKFGWEPRWYNPALERWLHRISVPTLVVWGENDKLFPKEYAARWAERVPNCTVEIIPECGHVPTIEKPEITVQKFPAFHWAELSAMQFTFFHLMPYRPLDMAERHKHRAGWVVLPNNLYDAKKGADEYQSYIDQLVHAERLGFDVIAVNEHHQTAYGLMPAPNLIASALIQLTKKAKIAIIGRALPLVNNPINIAEEFAMLDNLSRGRIITGFVALARFRSRESTTTSATSICGRVPIRLRTRRSGYRRWGRPRPSSGRLRPSVSIHSWSPSADATWWHVISTSIASRHGNTATRLRLIRSDGPRPSMSPTATSAPAQKPRPALNRSCEK